MNFLENVFVSLAHYDDHMKDVIEYIRRGVSLIICGHTWWWKCQNHPNALLQYPGNRITASLKILKISNGTIPGLRLYHVVKYGSPSHVVPVRWLEEENRECFKDKDISKYLEYYIDN